jgi:hypothetical protein
MFKNQISLFWIWEKKNTGGYTIGIERVVETEKYNYQRKENNPEPDSMVAKLYLSFLLLK